jgi:hypothetical protein
MQTSKAMAIKHLLVSSHSEQEAQVQTNIAALTAKQKIFYYFRASV